MKKKPKLTTQAIPYGYKKYLLAMKLATLLCLFNLLPLSASIYSQNANFSFNFRNTTVKEVLNQMEQESQFRFFYNDKFIDLNRKITLKVNNVKVEELLNNLLDASAVTYKILDNNLIVITPKEGVQQQKISGVVIDATTNEPLIGVSIVVKGTTQGTVTDAEGKYSISVADANAIIVVSYIGYEKQEIKVGNNTTLNIAMASELTKLDEVVVVGYGVQKKSLVTGSIASVKAEDIGKTNISRAEQALQGRTSGVQVVPVSGAPGAGMNIRIRGYSSNASSNPIFVVDGIKTGDINYLDPTDIASIEVLKDAASSAIYGAEGGNGVVIISTKKGLAGKNTITYDVQHAFLSVGKLPKLMNAAQYAQFMKEPGTNGPNIIGSAIPLNYDTDWLKAIFEKGNSTKHHVSFSGGNEKSKYLVGISYFTNDGIIVGGKDKFERYSVLLNSDHQVNNWVKIGHSFDFSHFTSRGINENGGEFGGMIGSALEMDPTTPVEFDDAAKIPAAIQTVLNGVGKGRVLTAPSGNVYGISPFVAGEIRNPFVTQALNNGFVTNNKLLGNVYAEITPFKGLTYTSRLGLEYATTNNHYWDMPYYYDDIRQSSAGITHDNNDTYYKWTWENFISYARTFGDHNVSILAGMSAEDYRHNNINGTGSPMPLLGDKFAYLNASTHTADFVSGGIVNFKKESYFGRASYDYKGKYLLQGSVRYDGAGAAQVPKDKAWGLFPSVSGGWVISNEEFFPKTVLSNAKLRASWGQNGSLNALGEAQQFQYNSVITGTDLRGANQNLTYKLADGTFAQVYEPNQLPNPALTWETSQQFDLGIDLRAFNDRLSLTADYFVKTTKNLIMQGIPSYSSGNYAPQANGGEVENKGFEFELGYKNNLGDLHYSIDLNISPLKNKVTKIEHLFGQRQGGATIGTGWPNATMFEPNYPIYHFFGYKTHGIDPNTGDPIFVNKFGRDTVATAVNDNDRQDLGSAIPKFTYGGNIKLDYKGFDFTLAFAGAQGNKVLMGWLRTDKLASNRPVEFYNNRWTKVGDHASRPSANPNSNTYQSDQFIFDGSYLRIQTIQLGYTLTSAKLKALNIGSIRGYVSLDNFFTFTKYIGMDPQPTVQNNAPNNIGIDRGTYPMAKDIMLGASINF